MFLNIQIHLLILKTYDGQFTLTTKKSLHIIFKGFTVMFALLFTKFIKG